VLILELQQRQFVVRGTNWQVAPKTQGIQAAIHRSRMLELSDRGAVPVSTSRWMIEWGGIFDLASIFTLAIRTQDIDSVCAHKCRFPFSENTWLRLVLFGWVVLQ
jgi:hypothetical protein